MWLRWPETGSNKSWRGGCDVAETSHVEAYWLVGGAADGCQEQIEEVTEAARLGPPGERGQPVGLDIYSSVVLLARMAGWRPKKHRKLPGNEVLWRAQGHLQTMVRYRQSQRGPPH